MSSTKNMDMDVEGRQDQEIERQMEPVQETSEENLTGNVNSAEANPEAEEEEKKKVFPLLWLIVLFLSMLVIITGIFVAAYVKDQASRDKNVIELIPSDALMESDSSQNDDGSGTQSGDGAGAEQGSASGNQSSGEAADGNGSAEGSTPSSTPIPVRPGFAGSDLEGMWKNQTTVSIFQDYYNEGSGIWTVWSNNGDKIIAPGTGNEYPFQLKNTGNISMDYTLTIESVFDMGEVRAPIEVRLKTADGIYIAGDENTWITPEALNEVVETGTLAVNHYANYILEWQWPFESEYEDGGWDLNDTIIGDKAYFEDLNFTMTIRTTAMVTAGATPVAGYWNNGNFVVSTGDNANLLVYAAGVVIAAAALILLILVHKRKASKEEEKEKHEA